jgi:hypothetical protein
LGGWSAAWLGLLGGGLTGLRGGGGLALRGAAAGRRVCWFVVCNLERAVLISCNVLMLPRCFLVACHLESAGEAGDFLGVVVA